MSITVSLNECRCSGLALTYEREPSFCTLPRELRNEIYTLAVVKYDDQLDDAVEPGIITLKGSHGYHFTRDVGVCLRPVHTLRPHPLLQVDRQIRAKASPIFYGQINFVLEVPGRCLEFAEWAALRRICAAVGAHLKHLRRLEIMFAYPAHTGQDDNLAVSDNYIFDPTSVTCVKIDELDMLKQRARIEFAIDRDFMGQTADRLRQAERGMALAILQLRAEHRWLESVFPTSGMMFAVFEILYKLAYPVASRLLYCILHCAKGCGFDRVIEIRTILFLIDLNKYITEGWLVADIVTLYFLLRWINSFVCGVRVMPDEPGQSVTETHPLAACGDRCAITGKAVLGRKPMTVPLHLTCGEYMLLTLVGLHIGIREYIL